MRKFQKIKETTERKICIEVVCNVCKCAQLKDEYGNPTKEFVHISTSWGYFSKKDMTQQQADICEDCWDEICKTKFQIPISEEELDFNGIPIDHSDLDEDFKL